MKIKQKNSSHLILESSHIFAWIGFMIFFTFPFLFFGIIPLLVPYQYTLNCQRQLKNNECQLTKSGLFGETKTPLDLAQLRAAKIETNHDDNSGKTYQLILQLKTHQEYFGWGDRNLTEKEYFRNKINTFIKNQNLFELEIEYSGSPLVGIVFLLVGGFLLFYGFFKFSIKEVYEFSKNKNLFFLKRCCFLWSRSTSEPLDNLARVKIMKDSSGDSSVYKLYLMKKSGEDIYLSFFQTENEAIKIAENIQEFLGLNNVLLYTSLLKLYHEN